MQYKNILSINTVILQGGYSLFMAALPVWFEPTGGGALLQPRSFINQDRSCGALFNLLAHCQ
jgi:hypothetical protein